MMRILLSNCPECGGTKICVNEETKLIVCDKCDATWMYGKRMKTFRSDVTTSEKLKTALGRAIKKLEAKTQRHD